MTSSIALVACCKSKLKTAVPVPAAELYTGQLFKAQMAYAQQVLGLSDNQICIMSAKWHLIRANWKLLPYEKTLLTFTAAERKDWGREVAISVTQLRQDVSRAQLLGGKLYCDAVRPYLLQCGIEVMPPPHPTGLGYALQVKWYREATAQQRP